MKMILWSELKKGGHTVGHTEYKTILQSTTFHFSTELFTVQSLSYELSISIFTPYYRLEYKDAQRDEVTYFTSHGETGKNTSLWNPSRTQ